MFFWCLPLIDELGIFALPMSKEVQFPGLDLLVFIVYSKIYPCVLLLLPGWKVFWEKLRLISSEGGYYCCPEAVRPWPCLLCIDRCSRSGDPWQMPCLKDHPYRQRPLTLTPSASAYWTSSSSKPAISKYSSSSPYSVVPFKSSIIIIMFTINLNKF